jgi:hypothetical protein
MDALVKETKILVSDRRKRVVAQTDEEKALERKKWEFQVWGNNPPTDEKPDNVWMMRRFPAGGSSSGGGSQGPPKRRRMDGGGGGGRGGRQAGSASLAQVLANQNLGVDPGY